MSVSIQSYNTTNLFSYVQAPETRPFPPPLTAPSESWLASFVTSSTAMGEKIVRILPNYYVIQINWYTIGDILIELSFIHLQYEKCGRLAQSIYKYAGIR